MRGPKAKILGSEHRQTLDWTGEKSKDRNEERVYNSYVPSDMGL